MIKKDIFIFKTMSILRFEKLLYNQIVNSFLEIYIAIELLKLFL